MVEAKNPFEIQYSSERPKLIIPPHYRVRKFLEWQLIWTSELSLKNARMHNIDPDHTVESLEKIELLLPRDSDEFSGMVLPDMVADGLDSHSPSLMWLVHMVLGSYFGEVLVRNLHGRWRYPSRLHALIALLLFRPNLLYGHWYVVVGKQKVPVFELAKRRETLGSGESLVKVYHEIASGTYTRRKNP